MRFFIFAAAVTHHDELAQRFHLVPLFPAYDCEGREFDGDFNPAGVQ